jgi:hypothetical protein
MHHSLYIIASPGYIEYIERSLLLKSLCPFELESLEESPVGVMMGTVTHGPGPCVPFWE